MKPASRLRNPLRALQLLAAPVLETWWLRRAFHAAFGPNLLQLGIHATDIYVPLLLVLGALCLWLPAAPFAQPRLQRMTLALNAVCLLITTGLLAALPITLPRIGAEAACAAILLAGISAWGTSFFLWLPARALWREAIALGPRLLYPLIAVPLLLAYPYILAAAWQPLAWITGQACYWVLRGLGFSLLPPTINQLILLWHPDFAASINMGCSGLEGIFFFWFAYLLLSTVDRRPPSLGRAAGIGALGGVFMMALNIARIVLFFAVAVFCERHASRSGKHFFVWAFHANVGWILYLAGVWWFLSRRWVRAL